MKVNINQARALFQELGVEKSAGWDINRMRERFNALLEIVADPKQVSVDQFDTAESKQLFKEIKAAKSNGKTIEIVDEEVAETVADEAAPAAELAEETDAPQPATRPKVTKKETPAQTADTPAGRPKPPAKKATPLQTGKKQAGRPQVSKNGDAKHNEFGAVVGSNVSKIDDCISKQVKSVSEISEESGVNRNTVNYRLWALAKDKKIKHVAREGYCLK